MLNTAGLPSDQGLLLLLAQSNMSDLAISSSLSAVYDQAAQLGLQTNITAALGVGHRGLLEQPLCRLEGGALNLINSSLYVSAFFAAPSWT
jgi:hypothetical protein